MKTLVRNEYLQKLIDVIETPDIKVISGVRRSGKSFLLGMFEEYINNNYPDANIIKIDFNDLSNENLEEYHTLYDYVESHFLPSKTNFIIIDEVQMCKNFEKALNSLHSKNKYKIYVTGSNAFLLSSDLATLFTGRAFTIVVYPFSFKEFIEYYEFKDLSEAFGKYLAEGGFAGSFLYKSTSEKYDYLSKDIYQTIIIKDIMTRYKIKNKTTLINLSNFMVDNISNLCSINKITKYLNSNSIKITDKTISNYVNYLCDSYIFYKVNRFDIKGKRYLSSESKYYLCDHALKYAILGNKNLDTGRVYENIVAIELLRRGYEIYTGILYNAEIDFVAIKRGEELFIQVSKSIDDESTFKREVTPLLRIKNAYPKILITRTKEKEYLYEGVKIIDIAEFLAR